jgi:antirestriction protein ArdC
MKFEEIQKLTNQAIEQLACALNAGKSEELVRYLAAMGRFHHYSLHNVMLIALQKPTAPHVAGFHTWKKLGRCVKRGEKGIYILAPLVARKQALEAQTEKETEQVIVGFRACVVFDESQTSGRPLPNIGRVSGDPQEYHERLVQFVASEGIALGYSADIAPARGISEGGKITLLPDMPPAEEFAVLVHETAHELLHHQPRRAETTKRVRETEAEAVAFVVCHAIGLETGTACQNYIQLYSGGSALLMESLEHVRSASARILDGIRVGELSQTPQWA